MGKELRIDSDEAYAIAGALAERLGKTATEVVVAALKDYSAKLGSRGPQATADEIARRRAALNAAIAATWGSSGPPEGATSDHSWLYDERGLPI